MSNALARIEAYFTVGQTLYVMQWNRISGQVWNNVSLAFENYTAANWAQYAVPLTEKTSSGYYSAARPAGLAGALITDVLYLQSGGSPTTADAPPQSMGRSAGENLLGVAGDPSSAPTNLQAALSTETQGAVASGVITASSFPTSLTNTVAAAYQGMTIRFITGAAAGMVGLIANYTPTAGVMTLAGSLATAPAAGDTFIIT